MNKRTPKFSLIQIQGQTGGRGMGQIDGEVVQLHSSLSLLSGPPKT